jgi:hypothetical protein
MTSVLMLIFTHWRDQMLSSFLKQLKELFCWSSILLLHYSSHTILLLYYSAVTLFSCNAIQL